MPRRIVLPLLIISSVSLVGMLFHLGLFASPGEYHKSAKVSGDGVELIAPVIKLGDVSQMSGRKECAFQFLNNYSRPVRILSVEPSCGCIAGQMDQGWIAPGEAGYCSINFDPGSQLGDFKHQVLVRFDPSSAVAPVVGVVEGRVIARLQLDPRKVDLGHFSVQVPNVTTIDIKNLSNEVVEIREASSSASIVEIADVPKQLPAKSSAAMQIIVPAHAMTGQVNDMITLTCQTGDQIKIPVKGFGVDAPAKCQPPFLNLGFVDSDSLDRERMVRIISFDQQAITVEDVDTKGLPLVWKCETGKKTEIELRFAVDPKATLTSGRIQGVVSIRVKNDQIAGTIPCFVTLYVK